METIFRMRGISANIKGSMVISSRVIDDLKRELIELNLGPLMPDTRVNASPGVTD